jgi:hypothetical protein
LREIEGNGAERGRRGAGEHERRKQRHRDEICERRDEGDATEYQRDDRNGGQRRGERGGQPLGVRRLIV